MFKSYYEMACYFYADHKIFMITCIILSVVWIDASYWLLFRKAGVPAWYSLIPFWNEWKLFEMVWGDGYFFLFELIPYFGFVFRWIMLYKCAMAFDRGDKKWLAFILLLPLPGRLALGLGSARYIGPEGRDPSQNPYKVK